MKIAVIYASLSKRHLGGLIVTVNHAHAADILFIVLAATPVLDTAADIVINFRKKFFQITRP
jgi:hypothetical protein